MEEITKTMNPITEQEEFEFRLRAEKEATSKNGNPVGNFIGGVAHGVVEPFAKLAQTGPVASVSRGLGSMSAGGGFNPTDTGANLPLYGHVESPKNPNEYIGNAVKAGSMFLAPEIGLAAPFAGYSGGQALSENRPIKDIINQALGGAIQGKGIELAAPVVGKGIVAAGKAVPSSLKNSAVSLLDSATGKLSRYTKFNANPARGLLEQNIASGSSPEEILFKVQNRLEELDQAKQELFNHPTNANKFVDASNLFEPLDKAVTQAKSAPETNSALINKLEKARVDLEGMVGEKDLSHLTLAEADLLKHQVGSLSKFSGNAAEKEYQTFDKTSNSLYGNLNSKIHEASPELSDIYSQQHDLTSASRALNNEDMLSGQSGQIAKLSKRGGFWTGLGAFGALAHGNPGIAAKLAAASATEEAIPAISSYPGIRSRVAQGLYNAGQGIENASQSMGDLLDKVLGRTKPTIPQNPSIPYTPPTRGVGPFNSPGKVPILKEENPIHIPYGQPYAGSAGEVNPTYPKHNPFGEDLPYKPNLKQLIRKKGKRG